jgi:hypothetical protein
MTDGTVRFMHNGRDELMETRSSGGKSPTGPQTLAKVSPDLRLPTEAVAAGN